MDGRENKSEFDLPAFNSEVPSKKKKQKSKKSL